MWLVTRAGAAVWLVARTGAAVWLVTRAGATMWLNTCTGAAGLHADGMLQTAPPSHLLIAALEAAEHAATCVEHWAAAKVVAAATAAMPSETAAAAARHAAPAVLFASSCGDAGMLMIPTAAIESVGIEWGSLRDAGKCRHRCAAH